MAKLKARGKGGYTLSQHLLKAAGVGYTERIAGSDFTLSENSQVYTNPICESVMPRDNQVR